MIRYSSVLVYDETSWIWEPRVVLSTVADVQQVEMSHRKYIYSESVYRGDIDDGTRMPWLYIHI